MTYEQIYQAWKDDPLGFWEDAAEDIDWYEIWDTVLDDSQAPIYRWFKGAKVNTCYNALDRHIDNGRADQLALIYDSPVTNSVRRFTYRELRDEVAKLAGVIHSLGIEKGDRVLIYMPMVPEAAMAMLACARIGAVHSVVFGGFAPNELATRINDAKPKLIMSGSCGIEPTRIVEYKPLLDAAIQIAQHKPDHVLMLQRPQHEASMIDGRDVDWATAMATAEPVECVPVEATDPLYILYTSGTTGIPKGVVRDNGGHLVALYRSMGNIYGVEAGDVYWAASDVGWAVGHSYIVYAPLFKGCTSILYEGKPVGTPDAGAFWRVIEQHGVKVLFTAPTTFRAIRREDPQAKLLAKYNLKHFKALFLAGERCDPNTLLWAQEKLGVPVIDHWWQTETGWTICGNPIGIEQLPIKPGSAAKPMPGYIVEVLDASGKPVAANDIGSIMIRLPLPPGTLPTLWQNDKRYIESYLSTHEGYYLTADAGFLDDDGYLHIMARTDDIINVAGHRLSTGGMEQVLASHPAVAECAVVGVYDELKGEVPVGLLVLNADFNGDKAVVVKEVVQMVRDQIGPVASFKQAAVVAKLPKTRSGKILRRTIKAIAEHTPYTMPATIDDASALTEVEAAMTALGYTQPAKSD